MSELKPLDLSPHIQTFGGDEQNRTVDPLLARQVLSQLSYAPVYSLEKMVGSRGLEPPTSRLSGVRSNRLSYEPISSSGLPFLKRAFKIKQRLETVPYMIPHIPDLGLGKSISFCRISIERR